MKKTLTIITFLVAITFTYAQKIKLRKGKIFADDQVILICKADIDKFSIYKTDCKTEQIHVLRNRNETPSFDDDDFTVINFLTSEKKLETTKHAAGSNQNTVRWLFNMSIFDKNGNINDQAIIKAIVKYDENITNRTIRN